MSKIERMWGIFSKTNWEKERWRLTWSNEVRGRCPKLNKRGDLEREGEPKNPCAVRKKKNLQLLQGGFVPREGDGRQTYERKEDSHHRIHTNFFGGGKKKVRRGGTSRSQKKRRHFCLGEN